MKLSFKNKRAYLRATLLSVYLKLQQLSLIFNGNNLKMRFTLLNLSLKLKNARILKFEVKSSVK